MFALQLGKASFSGKTENSELKTETESFPKKKKETQNSPENGKYLVCRKNTNKVTSKFQF